MLFVYASLASGSVPPTAAASAAAPASSFSRGRGWVARVRVGISEQDVVRDAGLAMDRADLVERAKYVGVTVIRVHSTALLSSGHED